MPANLYDPPQGPIKPGDKVRVVSGDFQRCRGVVVAVNAGQATVRFVVFGRDTGTVTFPTSILEPVSSIEPPFVD
jgi:transcription antitermination factor NusG